MATKAHKVIYSNYSRKGDTTRDTKLIKIENKVFKFSYNAYNCAEHFTGELFDGDKFNHIFALHDVGKPAESSVYIWDESKIKTRLELLTKNGLEFVKLLM